MDPSVANIDRCAEGPRGAFWGHHTGWGETGGGWRLPYLPHTHAPRLATDRLKARTGRHSFRFEALVGRVGNCVSRAYLKGRSRRDEAGCSGPGPGQFCLLAPPICLPENLDVWLPK